MGGNNKDHVFKIQSQIANGEIPNANEVLDEGLKPLEQFALKITNKVGSVGFFLTIVTWTFIWCGYNMLASLCPTIGLRAFDPFPAFVAWLLISNVIQICLMPLIMVGQNLQGRHSEIRAQLDFEVNQKAEREIILVLNHLSANTELVLKLIEHLNLELTEAERANIVGLRAYSQQK